MRIVLKILSSIGGFFAAIFAIRRSNRSRRPYEVNPSCKTKEEFVDLVKASFGAEYKIVENYEVKNIDPYVYEARPYTLAFFRNEQLVLTILFTQHNGEKNKYFLNAKRACEVRGIKCLNFFEHFPNQDDYVINRIRENL